MNLADIHFQHPQFIWIWAIVITVAVYLFMRAEKKASLQTIASDDIKRVFGIGFGAKLLRVLLIWSIGIIMGVIMAQPYTMSSDIEVKKDGIDIMLVLDISGSMDFADFKPNRLEVAKQTLRSFVSEISSDRVGLIVFAGKPISSQPLTFDYDIINETITSLSTDILDQNVPGLSGTNIGDALLLSKSLFMETPLSLEREGLGVRAREKVIILVTDGDANSGADPALVAQVLDKDNITIYSVGIGKEEPSNIKVNNGFFTQTQTIPALNSSILKTVAKNSGGVFFLAENDTTLKNIFKKLEELQTSELTTNIKQYQADYYSPFIYSLLLLLLLLSFIELIHPRCK